MKRPFGAFNDGGIKTRVVVNGNESTQQATARCNATFRIIPEAGELIGDPLLLWINGGSDDVETTQVVIHRQLEGVVAAGVGVYNEARIGDEFSASVFVRAYAGEESEIKRLDLEAGFSFQLEQIWDPEAFSLNYKEGENEAEDIILAEYDYGSSIYITRLYWSTDACIPNEQGSISTECYHERYILPAYVFDNPPLYGNYSIPLSSLKNRPLDNGIPVTRYTHLMMHLDDGITPSHEGDVSGRQGDDPSNNYAILKIDPKLVLDDVKFNEEKGGLDINYRVEQAGFLPPNTTFNPEVLWLNAEGVSRAAPLIPPLDSKSKHRYIPPWAFNPPELTSTAVGVRVDENDQLWVPLVNLEPTLTFLFPENAFNKQNFDVSLFVRNNAPVPLNVKLNWSEIPLYNEETLEKIKVMAQPSFLAGTQIVTLPYMEALDLPLEVPLGTLKRSWDWIPNPSNFENVIRQVYDEFSNGTIKEFAAKLIDFLLKQKIEGLRTNVAGPFLQILDINKLLQSFSISPKFETLPLQFTGESTALALGGKKSKLDSLLVLNVPSEPNKTALDNFALASAGSALHSSLALTGAFAAIASAGVGGTIAFGALTALLVDSAYNLAKSARAHYVIAYDPPDFNFTEIVELGPPLIVALPSETPAPFASKIRSIRHDMRLMNAISTTEDRILGAQLSGEKFWEMNQKLALSDLQFEKAWGYQAMTGVGQLISKAFHSLVPYSDGARTDFLENGLPDEITKILKQLGASQEEIDAFSEQTKQSPSDLGAHSDFSWQAEVVQSLFVLQSSYVNLVEAVRIRSMELGLPIRELSTDELLSLNALRSEIQNQFEASFISRSLAEDIRSYNAALRTLLLASNNLNQLKEFVDFGYNVFLGLQLNDIRPQALAANTKNLRQDGDLSSHVEAFILAICEQMELALTQTKYDVYESELKRLHEYVGSLNSSDLSDRARSLLLSFTDYVLRSVMYSDLDRNRHDVNSDRSIDPLDVLALINRINVIGIGPVVPAEFGARPPFFDVNKDGAIDPLDVLDLINYLNSVSYDSLGLVGEGEQQESSLPLDSKEPDSQIENFMLVDSFFEDFFPSTRSLRRRWL
ncbi:MAG: dockerin type I domain-containing protein [Pirellula sp.]